MDQNEDKISLVDLLVVLLKHWKMLVVLPVLVVLATGAYLYLKQTPKNSKPTETYVTLTVNPLLKQYYSSVFPQLKLQSA